jgi:hypothetical protein
MVNGNHDTSGKADFQPENTQPKETAKYITRKGLQQIKVQKIPEGKNRKQ